ncbi:MAG TPA: ABC transporter permease [Candidatus Acidoferrales bacterium]|nr:ABC transporter permease [Candidatus Acidoferrales bacterium]
MNPERWPFTLPLRLRSLFRRRQADGELDEELRDHVERKAREYAGRGMSGEGARRAALIELGGLEQAKEACRDARRVNWVQDMVQDLRYGSRILRKSPGFTTVVVVTLALGIGANTAIFSVVDSILLRSLPFKGADRLVDITEYDPGRVDSAGVPFPDYVVWKQQNTVFEETAAYFLINASNDVVLGGASSAERERYSTVTNSFFDILGVHPERGHGFSASDEVPGGAKVFLASDALWRGMLGGDPHAIGKTYLLDGENYTLAGVMPPGFDFPKGCSVWVPTSTLGARGLHDRISHPYHVLGRLRPGTSLSQAEAQIETIQERLAKAYPNAEADWHVRAQPLLDEIVGDVKPSLLVLLDAVGFILLIACTNVVNLMLARSSAREREFAIRSALGAGRMRLLRQNVAEGFLLVSMSSVLAVAFAKWGLALAVSLTSVHLPRMESLRLSVPLLAFLAAVAALTTSLVGLAPALQGSRQDPQGGLREGQRAGTMGRRSQRLRNGLVVSEVALALVLLCGAGLMLRSFLQLNRVNPGFQPGHLLTFKVALPGAEYPKSEQTKAFFDRLLERLPSIPGVRDAAAITFLPLSGQSDWGRFEIEERPAVDWSHAPLVDGGGGVSINYFRTLGIALLRGREFTTADAQNRNTIVINEATAEKFWPGADPLGQHIVGRNRSNPREIIGIVADVKSAGLDAQDEPEMYAPYGGAWYMNFVLRTNQEPASVIFAVRAQVAALDKGVPVYQVATMDQLLSRSLAPERFDLFLLALFGLLALGLAAVGIYGVLAFSVSGRTQEIGVRQALGAHQGDILRLIVRQGMKLAVAGILLGIGGAAILTRLMASLLYGVSATDPETFLAAAVLLAMVAMMACYVPARRATRVAPMAALRCE